MVGVNAFKLQVLGGTSNTTDAAHSFALADKQTLSHIAIGLTAGGPCEATAWIYNENDTNRPILLKESGTIRADNVFGTPDVWSYDGSVRYQDNSTLRIWVRNDTGSSVTWFAAWRTDP